MERPDRGDPAIDTVGFTRLFFEQFWNDIASPLIE
jgi:hypothetical protein